MVNLYPDLNVYMDQKIINIISGLVEKSKRWSKFYLILFMPKALKKYNKNSCTLSLTKNNSPTKYYFLW